MELLLCRMVEDSFGCPYKALLHKMSELHEQCCELTACAVLEISVLGVCQYLHALGLDVYPLLIEILQLRGNVVIELSKVIVSCLLELIMYLSQCLCLCVLPAQSPEGSPEAPPNVSTVTRLGSLIPTPTAKVLVLDSRYCIPVQPETSTICSVSSYRGKLAYPSSSCSSS